MQNNKELQEQIMQKLEEARSLNAVAEVKHLFFNLMLNCMFIDEQYNVV